MMRLTEYSVVRDASFEEEFNTFPVETLREAINRAGKPITFDPCTEEIFYKMEKAIAHYTGKAEKSRNEKWAYYQLLIEDLKHLLKACRSKDFNTIFANSVDSHYIDIHN